MTFTSETLLSANTGRERPKSPEQTQKQRRQQQPARRSPSTRRKESFVRNFTNYSTTQCIMTTWECGHLSPHTWRARGHREKAPPSPPPPTKVIAWPRPCIAGLYLRRPVRYQLTGGDPQKKLKDEDLSGCAVALLHLPGCNPAAKEETSEQSN